MTLRLVKMPKKAEPPLEQKSREEYLVACLREEADDPKFTDWERKFIASLSRQLRQGRQLTEKQKEILERIWEK
jgi:hypothetical protein